MTQSHSRVLGLGLQHIFSAEHNQHQTAATACFEGEVKRIWCLTGLKTEDEGRVDILLLRIPAGDQVLGGASVTNRNMAHWGIGGESELICFQRLKCRQDRRKCSGCVVNKYDDL